MCPDFWGLKGRWGVGKLGGKGPGLNPGSPFKMADLGGGEGRGMRGVAGKRIDIAKDSDCEGRLPGLN